LVATIAAGVGSVWLAALLAGGIMQRYTQGMLSFAAGALLATAFLHLLPEALEAGGEAHTLLAWLLAGLVFFFVLDKAELYHHGHEHSDVHAHGPHDHGHAHEHRAQHAHAHHHGHSHGDLKSGGWVVLFGDSIHAFGDGILIASAFLVDWHLGALAAMAVAAHEVPHHMGDLAVVRQMSPSARAATFKVSMAGTVTALGGLAGYHLLATVEQYLPIVLMLASSSFIYVALADLIPQLQKHHGARQTASQLVWLGLGVALIVAASANAHVH
jgi:zinc and cadmium transporter